jgi:SSS family solute:Na+ symporter
MNIADLLRPLDFAVILLYLVIVVGLGFYVAYQQRDQTNILLARKSLGWKGIGLSIWATNVGPPFLIGASGIAYTTGMVTANFEWLAWVFLMLCAMVFAPHYLGLNIDTIPQIIKRRFGEATYRLLTVYVLYTVIMLWLGGALYAGGVLVAQIMGWSPTLSIICLIIIATSFTAFGGLAAVVATDSLQTILIIGGTLTLTVLGIVEVGGIEGLIDKTPPDYWVLFKPADSDTFPWTAVIFGYPVLAIWFWCTDQTIVQRMLGARDLHTAQKGALLAGFLKILPPLIFTLPGILCFILYPGLSEPDAAFTTMVGNLLPVGLKGLIIAVLIAALVSTVDSGLNSFSTVFTLDVYVPIIKKGKAVDPQEIKRVGAIATIGAGIFATLWAIAMGGFASGMFELLQGVSSFLAPPMTALFLLTIFWRGTTSRGVIGGFLSGVKAMAPPSSSGPNTHISPSSGSISAAMSKSHSSSLPSSRATSARVLTLSTLFTAIRRRSLQA